jgi:metallophosphoesterase (TIGR00282 family)
MRFLFLGDVVGPPGLAAVAALVPKIRESERLSFVVANGENGTDGSGLNPRDYRALRAAGVDAVTLGDHVYKKFAIADLLARAGEPVCKPANYPAEAPGKDYVLFDAGGVPVAVFCLLGRTYMRPVDCPFAAADRVLNSIADRAKVIVVDVHAEATADKYLLAHYLDGRVTAVLGTHTHVQTADEQILSGGTAFISDAGMCGPYAGVLGRQLDRVLRTARTFEPTAFDVATGDVRLSGVIVDCTPDGRKAVAVRRVIFPWPGLDSPGSAH